MSCTMERDLIEQQKFESKLGRIYIIQKGGKS